MLKKFDLVESPEGVALRRLKEFGPSDELKMFRKSEGWSRRQVDELVIFLIDNQRKLFLND